VAPKEAHGDVSEGGDKTKVVPVVVSGLPLSAADRVQWRRFMAAYIGPKRRAQVVKLVRDHPAVLRAVEHRYKEMFGVKYTERAKESQRLKAIEAIGDTRSVARALLLSFAPAVELRSLGVAAPKLAGSALSDVFAEYAADDRARVLAFLAQHHIETLAELRELFKTRPLVLELENALGSDYYERAERRVKLEAALGLQLSVHQQAQLEQYERRRRSGQQERIERDVWQPWLQVGAHVPVMMYVSYVQRRRLGGDELRWTMGGTVVHVDVARRVVAIRLDAETPETKELRQNMEAKSNIQLVLPYERTFAFLYRGRHWAPDERETEALPIEFKTDNSNFSYPRGCIALPRHMIETLVDVFRPGTTVEIHKRIEPDASRGAEEEEEDGKEQRRRTESQATEIEQSGDEKRQDAFSGVRGVVVDVTHGVEDAYAKSTERGAETNRCGGSLPQLRARTLTKPSRELVFAIGLDTNNYSTEDLYMAVRDCLYCRMPILSTDAVAPQDSTYEIDLVPSVAALLREFRGTLPAPSGADVLWKLVEQFI
jgi:hypothetical protein